MNNGASPDSPSRPPTTGVILAGGLARRMGGNDKGLLEVNDKPMVLHIRDLLRPQVDHLMINANRNLQAYAALTDCPVVPDQVGDFAGPLAGMASALFQCRTPYLVAVPCDSPFVAPDLVRRLHQARQQQQADIAMATAGDKLQPVFVLLSRDLRGSLQAFLDSGGRKIIDWYYQHKVIEVDFADRAEMFENINTPEEQRRIEQQWRRAI